MDTLTIHECYISKDGLAASHYFFAYKEEYSIDICDSAFLTMYPDVMAYLKKEYPDEHPQTKTLYAMMYDEEDMDDRDVPQSVRDELYKREKNLEYVRALEMLQATFEGLIKVYREGWTVSSKGTVVCNYAIKPFGEKASDTDKKIDKVTDPDSTIFKVVECFIALQLLPVGEPIPEEVNKVIEQFNALKLLEG